MVFNGLSKKAAVTSCVVFAEIYEGIKHNSVVGALLLLLKNEPFLSVKEKLEFSFFYVKEFSCITEDFS